MNPNGMPVSSSPAVTPMIASGMISHIRSVVRIELNRHTTDEHHERQHVGERPGQGGAGVAGILVLAAPFQRIARRQLDLLDLRAHPVEQLAGQTGPRVGVDGERREAIAAHHDRVFPDDLGAGSDLAQGDHPPGDRAPDLQAVDHRDVLALGQRRAGDDRQQPRLLRDRRPCRRRPARGRSRPRALQSWFPGPGPPRRA